MLSVVRSIRVISCRNLYMKRLKDNLEALLAFAQVDRRVVRRTCETPAYQMSLDKLNESAAKVSIPTSS